MMLTVSIARHTLRLEHRYAHMRHMAADFSVDGVGTPFEASSEMPLVRVTEADLAAERDRLDVPASDGQLEALALERAVSRVLAPREVIHMHAVAVAVDGEAYVFLADSGVGKSTQAAAWKAHFGERADIICDDKPFFSWTDDTLRVYGSPWRGKEGRGTSGSAPVKAFCLLVRGEEQGILPSEREESLTAFLRHVFIPEEAVGAAAVLSFANRVLISIPFWRMTCTLSPAVEAFYTVLSKKE